LLQIYIIVKMNNNNRIYRKQYFDRVEPYIGDRLIKVLTGQRRVGKSFVLFQLMDEIEKRNPGAEIIYINKEEYQFDYIRDYNDLAVYVESVKRPDGIACLFIDEVQEITGFEKALRSFQTSGKFDIYVTGSNATLLSGELASLLSGRYIQIKIYSLSYNEYLLFHKLEDSDESLQEYILYGGMPHLINLRKDERVYYEYLKNILDTIVLRDIVARFKVRNVSFLKDLIKFLADNTGSMLSAKSISDYLKAQKINLLPKTILEYLFFIESVFFVEQVKRADVSGKKIFETGGKFYFEDLGMRHSLLSYQQKDIGKVLENLVFHHLKTKGYSVFVGKDGEKEIDFIAEKPNEKRYIQVAYIIQDEKAHEREFGNLLRINDNYPKMVISMDPIESKGYKGIEHWTVRRFLREFGE